MAQQQQQHHQHRNVVIVGGVAGGMSCATRLRRLDEGAGITVIEKSPYISYANCGIPYALGGVIVSEAKLHLMTADKAKSWFNIDARLNTELLAINRSEKTIRVRAAQGAEETVPYGKLVLALGAEAFRPPIRGINAPHVFTLQTIPDLNGIDAFISKGGMHGQECQHAVVIGGGFIGLEAVENLVRRGLNVTVLEALPHVMPPVDPDMAEPLHEELRRNGVRVMLNARISEIRATSDSGDRQGAVAVSAAEEGREPEEVPADVVIVATGVRPRTAIALQAGLRVANGAVAVNGHMQTSDGDIYAVGDMVATPNLVSGTDANLTLAGPANREGRVAADHICGRERSRYHGNIGTAVCKVFERTIGLVGFSTEALARMKPGVEFEHVTVHPPHHAGYYPGATPLTVKVAFETPSGRLLGAQAVGAKGVDKRIDVLAMAIQAGMTIEDLEHVELAYAPPYGSAKDPVNMAGFVGGNVLRGDVRIVHAASLAASSSPSSLSSFGQVVDVRSPEEFGRGHLPGAVNIPIGNLRDRVGEIEKDAGRVLVYCWVGYRGYLAYRVLEQMGFDVYNLDGGFKAVSEGGFPSLLA